MLEKETYFINNFESEEHKIASRKLIDVPSKYAKGTCEVCVELTSCYVLKIVDIIYYDPPQAAS